MAKPSSPKRPSGSALVDESAISQADSLLEQLPKKPKEHWSLREAIDLLREPINAALDRGYSHDEIATFLADQEIRISVSSLKRYLAKTRADSRSQSGHVSAGSGTPADSNASTTPRRARRTSAAIKSSDRSAKTPPSPQPTAPSSKTTRTAMSRGRKKSS
ncbi:MAG: hypothetical protein KME20_18330 [Kaiparowitsia implicata GSE-PSE-MK54-09C]|nr:hypothetical protein [Kaiparowitsia implicata GSE-PSE-MK54-09C]